MRGMPAFNAFAKGGLRKGGDGPHSERCSGTGRGGEGSLDGAIRYRVRYKG